MTHLDPFVGLRRPIPALPAATSATASDRPSRPSANLALVPNHDAGHARAAAATTHTHSRAAMADEPSASLRAHVAAGMRAGLDGRQLRERVVAATVHEELGPGVPTEVVQRTIEVVLADPQLRAQLEAAIARERSATRRS